MTEAGRKGLREGASKQTETKVMMLLKIAAHELERIIAHCLHYLLLFSVLCLWLLFFMLLCSVLCLFFLLGIAKKKLVYR
jgi:uncharacterized RDD family membrane protein YckC